jgi:predicted metal-binding membrane protein
LLEVEPLIPNSEVSEQSIPLFVPDRLALIVSIVLLSAAAISWLGSYYLMPFMMMGSSSEMMATGGVTAIVSSLAVSSVGFFEVIWVIGMAAMMFPAMIPIVLFYDKIKTKLETNPLFAEFAGTPIFLAGYLATYALLGIGAYLGIYAVIYISSTLPILSTLSFVAPSAILITTGIYQFSPLKSRCLSQCISPFGFFATHSHKGLLGAFRMGFSHGKYCVGCCWAYMLVMLAVGAMSIPVMAALAGVIALEKVIVRGSVWLNAGIALGFIALGIIVGFFPSVLMLI